MKRRNVLFAAAAAVALVAGLILGVRGGGDSADAGAGNAALASSADSGAVVVYKSPACGCCGDWVDHLRTNGFEVRVEDRDDLRPVKAELGVPSDLAACHTAVVDGYVVEGHVPAADVRRLLEERPDVAGVAVPGMPVGSPGMEGPREERYSVVAFDGDGGREVFARH